MKRIMNDPALTDLPAPISLTPEQLASVATDTGAMLGAGGGIMIHIYGIIAPPPPYLPMMAKAI